MRPRAPDDLVVHGDSKALGDHVARGAADLAYLDPPFKVEKSFGARLANGHRAKGPIAYDDVWSSLDVYLAWLEEPVSPDNVAGQAEVRASTDIPIASGESEQTRFAFRELIAARAADILQPDVAIAGGITETLRICALAAAHGLTVAPHLWGSAILFASGLHLAIATPCVTLLELTRGDNPLLKDLVQEPFDLRDGFVHPSERPGLGVTLNHEFARSITV